MTLYRLCRLAYLRLIGVGRRVARQEKEPVAVRPEFIGGPHDGQSYLRPSTSWWVGVVMPLSPLRHDWQHHEAGSYYRFDGTHWRFVGFVAAGADWEALFFDRPRECAGR